MPNSQALLNFPKRRTRSGMTKSPAHYSPSRSYLLVEPPITASRPSTRHAASKAKTRNTASAVYSIDSSSCDESPRKSFTAKVKSPKRKQHDASAPQDIYCSPIKSPRKNLQTISPIRLKAVSASTFMTVSKNNSKEKLSSIFSMDSSQNGSNASDSSDDEVDISCHDTPVKESFANGKKSVHTYHGEKENVAPRVPVPSPGSQATTPSTMSLRSSLSSPSALCMKLITLLSPVKQVQNDVKSISPLLTSREKMHTLKDLNSPRKLSGISRNLFCHDKENLGSSVSSKNSAEASPSSDSSSVVQLKKVQVQLSDVLVENSMYTPAVVKSPLKKGGFIHKLNETECVEVPSSPLKTPKKFTANLYKKETSIPEKESPMKIIAAANVQHPCSPLKKLIVTESILRRSPRKHCPLNSPSRPLLTPTKKTSTNGVSPLKLNQDKVFVYQAVRRALSHTMPELVGRDVEVATIKSFLQSCLQENQKRAGAMYISGAPGTGKTAALTRILETLPEIKGISPVWVNCMGLQGASAVFARISQELALPQQPTELKTLRALEKHFSKKGKSIVLVLDEADQLETRHQELLYTIFEWPALQSSRLVLLAIANRLDLTERVLPRLATAGNCAPERLHFPPYTKQQILDILTDRLHKSQVKWQDVIRPAALQLLAGKVASVAGDARRALDVCRRAVDTCSGSQQSTKGASTAPNATERVVDIATILKIFNEVYGSRVVTTIASAPAAFPLQQKILLCCLLLVHKHAKQKHTTMGKLQEIYSSVCAHRQLPSVDSSEFLSLCCNLQTRSLIDIGKSKDIRMAKVMLSLNPDEAERALADRELILQILEDREALGRLAKKN